MPADLLSQQCSAFIVHFSVWYKTVLKQKFRYDAQLQIYPKINKQHSTRAVFGPFRCTKKDNQMNDNQDNGLMHPRNQHGEQVARFADAILGKPNRKTLDERLSELSEADRETVTRMARQAKAIADMSIATNGHSTDDYAGLLKQLNRNLQPQLQALAAELLDTIAPLEEVRKPVEPDYDAITKEAY